MKLTLKSKIQQQPPPPKSNSIPQKLLSSPCCDTNSKNEKQRHVFLRPPKKQQKQLYDLIKIDTQFVYSKVSTRVKCEELQLWVAMVLTKYGVKYGMWVGYLCAHCCHHYEQEDRRMEIIGLFVGKFRAAFQQKLCASSILQQTMKRVKKYCGDGPLTPTTPSLHLIFTRYQQTLLLEYLPAQYSEYIMERYLAHDGDIEQYVRLCTSLTHFVLNTANPVKEAHFVDLMSRPYMGTVQWPIVIANRHMFELEPVNTPLIQSV